MLRQFRSFMFKMLIALVIGTVLLSIMCVAHLFRLTSDITNEFFRS